MTCWYVKVIRWSWFVKREFDTIKLKKNLMNQIVNAPGLLKLSSYWSSSLLCWTGCCPWTSSGILTGITEVNNRCSRPSVLSLRTSIIVWRLISIHETQAWGTSMKNINEGLVIICYRLAISIRAIVATSGVGMWLLSMRT